MPYGLRRFHQAETLHFITSAVTFVSFASPTRKPSTSPNSSSNKPEPVTKPDPFSYVLMPEDVHILINEPPNILLDQWIKSFKQSTSRTLKGSRDQFWQARYFDRNITGEEARSEVIRYIHRNPVKRGLVIRPEDYSWSSYTHYTHRQPRHRRDRIRVDSALPANPLIVIEPDDEWAQFWARQEHNSVPHSARLCLTR